jgi:hypothetical protein
VPICRAIVCLDAVVRPSHNLATAAIAISSLARHADAPMSIEAQIRSAADTLVLRLAEDARQHVDAVVTEWTAAAAATAEAHQQALERLRAELE